MKAADSTLKLLFMGTPEFAVPALKLLHSDPRFAISAVVTQPDKPAGRGQKLQAPPVKREATAMGLCVLQPETLKGLKLRSGHTLVGEGPSAEFAQAVNDMLPLDGIVVIAFGKIVPSALLDLTAAGVVNVHPSLLPRWRGAAPIQQALFAGDRETGVTLMRLDPGLDTGPVYCSIATEIGPEETFGVLHDRLSQLGSTFLLEQLSDILTGRLTASPQPETGVTYAEKWDKEDLGIIWTEPADTSLRRIRASSPEPGARTLFKGRLLKIYRAEKGQETHEPPGTIVSAGAAGVLVACGDKRLISVQEVQFPGKNRILAAQAVQGRLLNTGDRFEALDKE